MVYFLLTPQSNGSAKLPGSHTNNLRDSGSVGGGGGGGGGSGGSSSSSRDKKNKNKESNRDSSHAGTKDDSVSIIR